MKSNYLQTIGAVLFLAIAAFGMLWIYNSVTTTKQSQPSQCDSLQVDSCETICADTISFLTNEKDSCCSH